ncbi:hypothetical protein GCM10011316_32250 [Roseibium aquae]|uniref:Methyl-accepting chemotaxis protein n=1 Tax=Roseibium aquae TaxID=1323746 RepID=A0A916TN12_9HYPH|nr:methyl-accepting chemotaxis protein [Roseibium aquae]GGB57739.1 hypothetical protein GCM10011316_32250 [Roseibium aquae]
MTRFFSNLTFTYKVWGGFVTILLLTAFVGGAGILALNGVSQRTQVSDQATAAQTRLQSVSHARETYMKTRSAENAGKTLAAIDDLQDDLAKIARSVPDQSAEASRLALTKASVDALRASFEKVTGGIAAQETALGRVVSASNELDGLTSSINDSVSQVQRAAAGAAEAAKKTQEKARALGRAAASIQAEAKALEPRFGIDGEYKAKDLTEEVMAEINGGLERMVAAAETLKNADLPTLQEEDTNLLFEQATQLQTALPDLLAETNLFNRAGKKKTVADLITVIGENALAARIGTYETVDLELAKATETQTRLAELADVSQYTIALASGTAGTRAGSIQFIAGTDGTSADQVRADFKTLETIAANLSDARTVLPEAADKIAGMPEAIKEFAAAFDQIVTSQDELGRLTRELDQLAADVGGQITAITVGQSDLTRKAGQTALLTIGGTLAVAILFGVLLAAVLNTAITRPIRSVTDIMSRLAGGERDIDVPHTERRDEIGAMYRTVEVFQRNAVERSNLEQQQRAEEEARLARQRRIEELVSDFRASVQDMLGTVEITVSSLDNTAQNLTGIARDSAARATDTLSASNTAASNVQTVASAAEELAASIGEISAQVGRTSEIVSKATEGTRLTNQKVEGLAESAAKIGEVINLIQAIAEQTNLLALNATIEAARAGEAGKGFAVVAAEVKELATQTSKATEEISAQISAIQAATEESAQAIVSITGTMDEVNDYTNAIAAAVQQQGSATNEISKNVQEAAHGTQIVTGNMSELNLAVDRTTQSAELVVGASEELTAKMESLKGEVDRFLTDVAAA